MSRYRIIAGRVRSTGRQKWYSPVLMTGATGGCDVPANPVVNAWEQAQFRCRSDFDHLVPDPDGAAESRAVTWVMDAKIRSCCYSG